MAYKSKVSPAIFVIATLCFLLPFVTVSCNGQKVASLSGMELATGTTVEQPQVLGPAQKKNVGGEPLAAVAGICAIAGIGLSFLGARLAIAPAISGAAGALMLLLLQSKLSSDITKEAQGMFRLDFEAGYVLALLFFVAGAAWNFYLFFQGRKMAAPASSPPGAYAAGATTAGSGTASASFCPHCGQALNAGARFCGGCGKAVG
jgi:zinc ribbon protein